MKKRKIETDIEIVDIGAKGAVIGKKDGIAYLCQDAVPGDVVTLEIRRKKKGMPFGRVQEITTLSPLRVDPVCAHFDHCGGCNWQNLGYQDQLSFKENRVFQQLRRIAGESEFEALPILGSKQIYHYRNKLEFTFVESRWLTPEEITSEEEITDREAVGFHVPGRFDWILHVDKCHLQDDAHNAMRQFIFEEAKKRPIPFYHPREKTGIMRNVLFRNNRKGDWMILLIVQEHNDDVKALCASFIEAYPNTHSFWVIVNEKVNDSFSDCLAEHIHGERELVETFTRPNNGATVDYLIGPKSFFQTNPSQAEKLYEIVFDFAGLDGTQNVYDLYTGTGSIALYVANLAKSIVGIEYVPEAIVDAKRNAAMNSVTHASFFAGDMKDVLNAEFIAEHGIPDVLITDPPRAGMHEDVITRILEAAPHRIVYVSCDPATQARDIKMLGEKYNLIKAQPVDMFPHTSHVENVALLELKQG
ncbi:MAG: 23S rRNA (uracil(1939)-C(5))-methyltransferase RlmD [Flavobacteriales bacterium]|nr:23S rRNA (uracil(1939)-C(5))-methyltransferase RlmD [Flavobacteriales bacterium]